MIYYLLELIGIHNPSVELAALAAALLVLGTIFGLMAIVFTFQHRNHRRNFGTNILRDERRAYWRYNQSAEPVETLVKPALQMLQEALFRRDGVTYRDLTYVVRDNTVVLRARRPSAPHPMMVNLSLELEHSMFDPEQPLEKVIWEKVLARELNQTESYDGFHTRNS